MYLDKLVLLILLMMTFYYIYNKNNLRIFILCTFLIIYSIINHNRLFMETAQMAIGDSLPKLNKDARATIMLAFEDLGGLPRLVAWANDSSSPQNLSTFYTQIWAKIIPKEIAAKIDTNQKLNITWDCESETIADYTIEDGISVNDLIESAEDDD